MPAADINAQHINQPDCQRRVADCAQDAIVEIYGDEIRVRKQKMPTELENPWTVGPQEDVVCFGGISGTGLSTMCVGSLEHWSISDNQLKFASV